jgi:hypothetical protein
MNEVIVQERRNTRTTSRTTGAGGHVVHDRILVVLLAATSSLLSVLSNQWIWMVILICHCPQPTFDQPTHGQASLRQTTQ